MRLITRADFDGLCCAALLRELELIDEFKFVHPKDVQDGLVDADENDILANIPYVEGAGMWFDHHSSEALRLKEGGVEIKGVKGAVKRADSAARVIWDYYKGLEKFPERFLPMMEAVDKVDSATLTVEEITKPEGWILLGFIMDPRTGLGRHAKFRIGNWELLQDLVEYIQTKDIDEIMELPDVKERLEYYFAQEKNFKAMLDKHVEKRGNVILMDLREADEIAVGNRFLVYALHPDCNVSVQVMWDKDKTNVAITVGHSIVTRTCKANIGAMMLEFGGGGHSKVGTCQVYGPLGEDSMNQIIERLQKEC